MLAYGVCICTCLRVCACVHLGVCVYDTSFCVEDTDWCLSQLLSPLFLETRPHWTWSVPLQLCRLASQCQESLSVPSCTTVPSLRCGLGGLNSFMCTAIPLLMELTHQTLPALCFETGSSYRTHRPGAHYAGQTGLELAVISNPLASLGWEACCTIIRWACGFFIDVLVEGIFSQKIFWIL